MSSSPAFKLPANLSADSRISTESTTVPSGFTYTYILGKPSSEKPAATIVLLHGFPDLALGWRHQILPLLDLNIRLIIPNLLGYSSTSAPASPEHYTYKSLSADLAALIKPLLADGERVILGGHDWGGALVYRFALWNPELFKGVFTICTPFSPPASSSAKYFHPAEIMPNFKYQLQFAGPDLEAGLRGEEDVRNFLNGLYGGRAKESNKPVFDISGGADLDLLKREGVHPSKLLTAEETDLYVDAYLTHTREDATVPPLRGPFNWYRVHALNFHDEQRTGWGDAWRNGEVKFEIPGLFVAGRKDMALPPAMGNGMENWWKEGSEKGGLSKGEVDAGHWALWERREEIDAAIAEWLEREFDVTASGKSRL